MSSEFKMRKISYQYSSLDMGSDEIRSQTNWTHQIIIKCHTPHYTCQKHHVSYFTHSTPFSNIVYLLLPEKSVHEDECRAAVKLNNPAPEADILSIFPSRICVRSPTVCLNTGLNRDTSVKENRKTEVEVEGIRQTVLQI